MRAIGLSTENILLGAILVLALLLRVVGLANYPVGFTADEASFGYDAHSLIQTGKDQWGEPWPITFRSFGDFKLPVYTYLAIPFVGSLGLTEFATRIPSAAIGVLAVFATYLMTKQLFKNNKLALVSGALLAISPWHLGLSRGAFEANLTVFFMTFGAWAFLKGLKDRRYLTLSAVSFGINLFTYHSARLITPLVGTALVLVYKKELGLGKISEISKVVKKNAIPIAVFLVFLGTAFYSLFLGGGSRAGDITIFNPTDKWAALSERRYEAVLAGVPSNVSRIFSNKGVYVLDQFAERYLAYLSPQFLFTQGVSEWAYGVIPGRGVLYIIELPFILMSVWYLANKGLGKSKGLNFIFFWILLSPLAAALTKGPGYSGTRAATMMPAIQVFSAFGGLLFFDLISKKLKVEKKLLSFSFIAVFAAFLLIFIEDYVYHAPVAGAEGMLYGRQEAVEYVDRIQEDYQKIVFSRSLTEPQIFVAFYQKWDPNKYQKATMDWLRYEEENLPFLDQLGEYSLGKYTFSDINYSKAEKGELLVGKPKEFPADASFLKTVSFHSQPFVVIFDPASE